MVEINHLRTTPVTQVGAGEVAGTTAAQEQLKPLFEGGLKVTVAERNVLDDVQLMNDIEEPSHSDKLGQFIGENLQVAAPPIPAFR